MSWPLSANLSMLFNHLPLIERTGAAARNGFDGVEIQFPYAVPAQQLSEAMQQARMPLVLFNLPAGDLLEGGAGLAGVPGREELFQAALEQALAYAAIARPQRVNVLPGRLLAGTTRDSSLETLARNLATTAEAFAGLDVKVVCEAINRIDMPDFLLATGEELAQMIDCVGHPNLSAQLDFYHMQRMGESLPAVIGRLKGKIGHVQFADTPERGAPGTGDLDFAAAFAALAASDYAGWIGAEYHSAQDSDDLAWLPLWRQTGFIRQPGRNV
ncbi:hydroxypyruvate isomerase family protein [Halopseudomonas salina]|uniref:Hydroxypyruvate isomerase n=1 Tax=Halopseudomonas salina TaxID=1323744 RepID=A0ABQ1PMK0_9GAMM|nr:TIM barrel protein [Halopseudomonas salina]GGC99415.1 hydroxypyruvate isomerase [Halopseudomonas salina]